MTNALQRLAAKPTILREHPGLFFCILLYLSLALTYFFIVPIFEAPDEWTHTGHVKYIAEGNGLPVMLPGQGIWGGQQPPLYYSIGALLVQPFSLDGVGAYEESRRNPHAAIGYALDPGNKNNYLHLPDEGFPYQGLALTVHILRLWSMALGLIALIFSYFTAYEFFTGSTAPHPGPLPEGEGIKPPPLWKGLISSALPTAASTKPPPLWKGLISSALPTTASTKPPSLWGGLISSALPTTASTKPPSLWKGLISSALPTTASTKPPPLWGGLRGGWSSLNPQPSEAKTFATTVAFFIACQPMFAFITASVANETANMAFSAIALWLTQRYVLYGPTTNWRRAIALGITLGLISLSKMTGLSFGLVAVVAFLQVALTTRKQPGAARLLWRDGIIIGSLFLLVGGWWYWRNYQLYGDFFQTGLYEIYFNDTPDPISLSHFLFILRNGEVSFWATFGWLNIVAPEWVYSVYRIISRVGLIGTTLLIILKPGRWVIEKLEAWEFSDLTISNLLIHLTFPVALAFSLTRLVAIEGGVQGRQLLPALGAISIVIVWGWWILAGRLRRLVFPVIGIALVSIALWLPYGLVKPAYFPRPLLTETDLPLDLTRLDLTYNDEIKLLGVDLDPEVVRPGERVPVTVYWQALQPMQTNYSVFVHLVGRGYENVGQLNTYPALGLRPTTTLQPGDIVVDTYPILVNGGSQAPSRLLVNVGLFDFNEAGRPGIQPTDSNGQRVSPTAGQLKLIPNDWPAYDTNTRLADFADRITLLNAEVEGCQHRQGECHISLTWLGQGQPVTNYTVFIQLWSQTPQTDPPFYGFDSPPLSNDYPTSLWAAEEVINDPHSLDLSQIPPGSYQLLVGLYNPDTGERLPAFFDEQPLPDYAVKLDIIEVNE